jgi:hypothetical protein
MIIELKKFGTTLSSRDSGREAYNAILLVLNNLQNEEELILDFTGVNTFTPSWGDEFISNIYRKNSKNLVLVNTKNQSVKATLELLSEINNMKFNIKE